MKNCVSCGFSGLLRLIFKQVLHAALIPFVVLAGLSPAIGQETGDSMPRSVGDVLVGDRLIPQAALEQAIRSRSAGFSADPEEGRRLARDTVLAEYWVDETFGEMAARDPQVRAGLDEARRQVLFEVYAQSLFDRTPPTAAEIDAFIADNAPLFEDRRAYRFLQVQVGTRDMSERALLEDVLERIAGMPRDAWDSALPDLLDESGLDYLQARYWSESERLTPAILTRLQRMEAEDRRQDVQTVDGSQSVLLLLESQPIPIDPAGLREDIANRVLQARYREHRLTLASDIAAPLLTGEGPQRAEAAPMTEEQAIWMASLGAVIGFALGAALRWYLRARQYFVLARRANIDELDMARLRLPFWVGMLALLISTATLAGAGVMLTWQLDSLAQLEPLTVFAGAVVLMSLFSLLFGRRIPDTEPFARRAMFRIEQRVLMSFLIVGILSGYAMLQMQGGTVPSFEINMF